MKIAFSPESKKELEKIKRKDPGLNRKIRQKLQLFIGNPTHPSLKLHKLSGSLKNFQSISITRSFRMIYQLKEANIAYFVDMGTHDEVYKK